ncbi:MAG: hypothetical protein K2Y23_26575 [Cyanobacteria bacterium]|nr:hypothetical protein [Cyanobacteriota bacterium]
MPDPAPPSLPWRTDASRSIAAIVLTSRVGVLVVGFLGILLVGYAAGTPPYCIYNNDLLDMPARWDTGWYLADVGGRARLHRGICDGNALLFRAGASAR